MHAETDVPMSTLCLYSYVPLLINPVQMINRHFLSIDLNQNSSNLFLIFFSKTFFVSLENGARRRIQVLKDISIED